MHRAGADRPGIVDGLVYGSAGFLDPVGQGGEAEITLAVAAAGVEAEHLQAGLVERGLHGSRIDRIGEVALDRVEAGVPGAPDGVGQGKLLPQESEIGGKADRRHG